MLLLTKNRLPEPINNGFNFSIHIIEVPRFSKEEEEEEAEEEEEDTREGGGDSDNERKLCEKIDDYNGFD